MQTKSVQTLFRKAAFLSVVLLLFVKNLPAQNQEIPNDLFFEIACFKVKQPGAVDFFKEWGKPIHEEMIRQGILVNWEVFSVDYPNGADCDCDLRAVRVFRDISSLDKIKSVETREAIIKKLWPEKNLNDIRMKFNKSIEFRHSEVYQLSDALISAPTKSELMIVNFMDVKWEDRTTYLQMEKEIFKPLHQANHKAKKLVDWVVAKHIIPFGRDVETDFITIDKFDNYTNFFNSNFSELFKTVHPEVDFDATMKKMGKKRQLIKAEIWRRVTETNVKPSDSAKDSNK